MGKTFWLRVWYHLKSCIPISHGIAPSALSYSVSVLRLVLEWKQVESRFVQGDKMISDLTFEAPTTAKVGAEKKRS